MVTANETTATKQPDFNKANIKRAIAQGKKLIKSGKSKADVSREIYKLLKGEDRAAALLRCLLTSRILISCSRA